MFEIIGNNEAMLLRSTDFDRVHRRVRNNPTWGAELLEMAGDYSWRVSAAKLYSNGPFGARVIEESTDSFVAWGITGNKSCLAYRVERRDERHIKVTPLAYLEQRRKFGLVVALTCIFVLPVLLTPLLWRLYEVQTLRVSKIYLPIFARYVQKD